MEHRCGYRRDIQVKVRVSTRGGLSGYGRLIEASGSGARLVTQLPIPIHSVVILTFDEMRNPDSKRLRLEAEVVRVTTDGYGIEWTQFAPTGLRTLYQDFATKADRGGASTAAQP
jgi:hypothetical protein